MVWTIVFSYKVCLTMRLSTLFDRRKTTAHPLLYAAVTRVVLPNSSWQSALEENVDHGTHGG